MKLRSQLGMVVAALSLSVLALAGCSNSTDPGTAGGVNTDPIVAPKQGSTYTFATYTTDSTGKKVDGSDATLIYTIAATNLTLGGKSNVVLFVSDASEPDSGFVHYESNGDITIYYGANEVGASKSTWLTIPFVSRTTQNQTLIDTMVDNGFGSPGQLKITSKVTGDGSENVTVGSETFSANKATWTLNLAIPFGAIPITTTSTTQIDFVPKLGFWAKQVSTSASGLSSTSGEVDVLTSYSLK